MARYLFRLSILGPVALDPARIQAAVGDAFRRMGFETEPPTITNIKGLAPPRLAAGETADDAPVWVVTVPPWGEIELDNTAAARQVRTLTQASIVIHGTLPPDTASGRAGSAVLSNAIFAAVNASLGPLGYYNLTGAARGAGLVASGGSGAGAFLVFLGLGGAYLFSQSSNARLYGIRPQVRRRPRR